MFVPYNVDVPMERIPFTNWVLIAVTTLVSIRFFLEPESPDPFAEPIWLPYALDPMGAFKLSSLVTYLFVHADIFHLAGNMLFLFVFGNAVNAKLGHFSFVAAYFLCGALAGLTWLGTGPSLPLIGASGAIMGIVGFFLVFFPRNDVQCFYFWSAGGGEFSLSSIWLILFYFGMDLWGTASSDGGGGVAYLCHIGGAVVGFAVGMTLAGARWIESTAYEENLLQMLGLQEKGARKPKRRKRKKKRARDE